VTLAAGTAAEPILEPVRTISLVLAGPPRHTRRMETNQKGDRGEPPPRTAFDMVLRVGCLLAAVAVFVGVLMLAEYRNTVTIPLD
jgi:hypothetical protein